MYAVNSVFRGPARLRGLGDSGGSVQVDTADVLGMGQSLRAEQARLTNLLAQMRTDPELARAIGRDVTAQQAALGDLISKYVGVYYAVFGQAPVGLGFPVAVAAAVAIILSYIAAQLYLMKQKNDVLEQQARAQILAEQNRGAIINEAQQKQQTAWDLANAGDAAGASAAQESANALFAQSGTPGLMTPGTPPPPPQGVADWLKANWITVAAIGGAIFIVPKIMGR